MELPSEPRADRRSLAMLGALAVAVVVVLAILLDLGPFADEELSKGEFLARGDEICRQAHEDFTSLQKEPPDTATEAAALTEELAEISEDELDAVRDLNGPAELDASVDAYLAAREDGIEELRSGVEAAEGRDALAYTEAQAKVARGQLERARLARRVGFDECSSVLFGREQLAQDAHPPRSTDPSAPPTVNNPPTGTP